MSGSRLVLFVLWTLACYAIPQTGLLAENLPGDSELNWQTPDAAIQLANFGSEPGCGSLAGCQCNACCTGWFGSVDFLYWQVDRTDLAYAIQDPVGNGVPTSGAPVLSLDLGGNSGVRAAIGRRTANQWELGVTYTHLDASDQQAFAPGASQVLAVLSSPATGLTNADSVTAQTDFQYDVIDFEAGRWFDPCDSLSLMVLGGVRFASIDHHVQAIYDGGQFTNGMIDVPTDIDAVGGRLGGAIHWNANSCLSLFGKTALSVLSSDVDARRRETNAAAVTIDASRPSEPILSALEVSLGMRYSRGNWSLGVGYEWTNWFNAVSPLEFSDSFNGGTLSPTQRDLGLHGFFANATLSR